MGQSWCPFSPAHPDADENCVVVELIFARVFVHIFVRDGLGSACSSISISTRVYLRQKPCRLFHLVALESCSLVSSRQRPAFWVFCAKVISSSVPRFISSSHIDSSSGWQSGPGKGSITGSEWSSLSPRGLLRSDLPREEVRGWLARRYIHNIIVVTNPCQIPSRPQEASRLTATAGRPGGIWLERVHTSVFHDNKPCLLHVFMVLSSNEYGSPGLDWLEEDRV